ncbi:hypothetical protein AN477_12170 [Alicyclobacillus ferrooxydans]|uniref:Spore cortex-lytic enzyme n=1 Tax=Alicyclobacillus ferrooxydans TaxID=471514 RepID=A0A0P9CKP6_9BACL|nr:hypothetical protein AN477_12170 [Alicyclobacillus ferrooxydans]
MQGTQPFRSTTVNPFVQVANAFTMRNLMLGSQGNDVYELQNRLKFLGYYKGKIDGKFGWMTYFSVRRFQQQFGMPVNGRVTLKTKQVLVKATQAWKYHSGGTSSPQTSTPSSPSTAASAGQPSNSLNAQPVPGITQSDINLLDHVVSGEARGEPYEGQVAVAAVILNRLKSPKFPHSIPGIIYAPGAFTCVSDGQINVPPDASVKKAVLAAIHGWDPTMGALYYFDPATATNKWIWSRPEILQIGHHIFCR